MSTKGPSPRTYYQLPGRLLRWELARILEPGFDFRIVPVGRASEGSCLYVVYRSTADREVQFRLLPTPRNRWSSLVDEDEA